MASRRRDERALVRSAQGGSSAAFEELFRLHWGRAHRAAYLVVHDAAAAEDIAQESFLAAVRNLDRFDRRRPFGPWLHRIVVNRAIDHARARALRAETGLAARPARRRAVGGRARCRAARCDRAAPSRAAGGDRPAPPARVHAPARSRTCWSCRAGRSTHGSAAGSTRCGRSPDES